MTPLALGDPAALASQLLEFPTSFVEPILASSRVHYFLLFMPAIELMQATRKRSWTIKAGTIIDEYAMPTGKHLFIGYLPGLDLNDPFVAHLRTICPKLTNPEDRARLVSLLTGNPIPLISATERTADASSLHKPDSIWKRIANLLKHGVRILTGLRTLRSSRPAVVLGPQVQLQTPSGTASDIRDTGTETAELFSGLAVQDRQATAQRMPPGRFYHHSDRPDWWNNYMP